MIVIRRNYEHITMRLLYDYITTCELFYDTYRTLDLACCDMKTANCCIHTVGVTKHFVMLLCSCVMCLWSFVM